jgi:hypothetical protein
LLFVLSALCFVLQLTWWQATHVVAGEDLEAVAPGAEHQPEVRRVVFVVFVLSFVGLFLFNTRTPYSVYSYSVCVILKFQLKRFCLSSI